MLAVLRSNNYFHLRSVTLTNEKVIRCLLAIIVTLGFSGMSYGHEVESYNESNLCRRAVNLLMEVNANEINLTKVIVSNREKHKSEYLFSGGNFKFKCTFNQTSVSKNSSGHLDLLQHEDNHYPMINAGKYEFFYSKETDLISVKAVKFEGA